MRQKLSEWHFFYIFCLLSPKVARFTWICWKAGLQRLTLSKEYSTLCLGHNKTKDRSLLQHTKISRRKPECHCPHPSLLYTHTHTRTHRTDIKNWGTLYYKTHGCQITAMIDMVPRRERRELLKKENQGTQNKRIRWWSYYSHWVYPHGIFLAFTQHLFGRDNNNPHRTSVERLS